MLSLRACEKRNKCHLNRQSSPRCFLVQVHFEKSHCDVRIAMSRWDTHQGESPLHNKPERRLPVTNRQLGIQSQSLGRPPPPDLIPK